MNNNEIKGQIIIVFALAEGLLNFLGCRKILVVLKLLPTKAYL